MTPTGLGWKKTPAVRGRESDHFYFRRDPQTDHRQWFMRDPYTRQWRYSDEDPRTGTMTCDVTPA